MSSVINFRVGYDLKVTIPLVIIRSYLIEERADTKHKAVLWQFFNKGQQQE